MTELTVTTDSPEAASIIAEILMEVGRAEKKHPIWPQCHVKQIAFISEESGELTRAGNLMNEGVGSFQDIRTEAVHTAATAIRFLKNLADTEAAFNEKGIIEYFEGDSEEPKYAVEREDHD